MNNKPLKILLFHQSVDMYGSDKTLLSLVKSIDNTKLEYVLVLPRHGPLTRILDDCEIKYLICPLILLSRSVFTISGFISFGVSVVKNNRALSNILKNEDIDCVYSNTLAVLSGVIWAKLNRKKHIWHVHEIIRKPVIVRKIFAMLLYRANDLVICNSEATLDNILGDCPQLSEKSAVVLNGVKRVQYEENIFRRNRYCGDGQVLIVMVGRLNMWKGHKFLIDTAQALWELGHRNVRYLVVGDSVVGQEKYREDIYEYLSSTNVFEYFKFEKHVDNIWQIWDICDIAVVPSTEPEPFGLVAIEAMMAGKPVVAAGHGGLAEIVVSGSTGYLFTPKRVSDFVNCLNSLVVDKELRLRFGRNGKSRAIEKFSEAAYTNRLTKLIEATARSSEC